MPTCASTSAASFTISASIRTYRTWCALQTWRLSPFRAPPGRGSLPRSEGNEMAILRDRPYTNFNFLVDLGTGTSDGPEAGFEEVLLPEVWVDVIEYRNGNDRE